MKIGDMFSSLDVSASGLALQRKKMNAIASNIANMDSIGPDGKPYLREEVKAMPGQAISFSQEFGSQLGAAGGVGQMEMPQMLPMPGYTVNEVAGKVVQDPSAIKTVYDPTNPNADSKGYVTEPNINVVTEMVDMITTTRSYQANVTAIQATKNIIKDSLEI